MARSEQQRRQHVTLCYIIFFIWWYTRNTIHGVLCNKSRTY